MTREIAVDVASCDTVWQVSEPFTDSHVDGSSTLTNASLANNVTALASGSNQAHNQEYVTDPFNIVLAAVVANITYSFTSTSVTYTSGYCSQYWFHTTGWVPYTTYSCTHSSTLTSSSSNKVYVNVSNAIYSNPQFCHDLTGGGTTYVEFNNVRIAGNPAGSFTASDSALPTIWGGCASLVFRDYEVGWGNETL